MDTGKRTIDTITNNGAATAPDRPDLRDKDDVGIIDFSSEVETLREELASERDTRLRLAAEYDNYRRRTKRESAKAADEGKRELLEQMLLIADELDLAVANLSDEPGWVAEWVHTVRRRFQGILEVSGIEPIESVGEKFDPIRRVGLYVPGGEVPLVSTVLMTVSLAKIAGCPEVAVFTPSNADLFVNFAKLLIGDHDDLIGRKFS